MSFGIRDADWVEPDDEVYYTGICSDCKHFYPCPCGCGWGYCDRDPEELFEGSSDGCEEGDPV